MRVYQAARNSLTGCDQFLGHQQLELHGDEPVRAALALGEANQLTADAEASVVGIRDEHPELTRAFIEALHADGADDPVAQAGHGDPRRASAARPPSWVP